MISLFLSREWLWAPRTPESYKTNIISLLLSREWLWAPRTPESHKKNILPLVPGEWLWAPRTPKMIKYYYFASGPWGVTLGPYANSKITNVGESNFCERRFPFWCICKWRFYEGHTNGYYLPVQYRLASLAQSFRFIRWRCNFAKTRCFVFRRR